MTNPILYYVRMCVILWDENLRNLKGYGSNCFLVVVCVPVLCIYVCMYSQHAVTHMSRHGLKAIAKLLWDTYICVSFMTLKHTLITLHCKQLSKPAQLHNSQSADKLCYLA